MHLPLFSVVVATASYAAAFTLPSPRHTDVVILNEVKDLLFPLAVIPDACPRRWYSGTTEEWHGVSERYCRGRFRE